jgi:hypothetical protein
MPTGSGAWLKIVLVPLKALFGWEQPFPIFVFLCVPREETARRNTFIELLCNWFRHLHPHGALAHGAGLESRFIYVVSLH